MNKISSVVARMYGVFKFGKSSCRPFKKKKECMEFLSEI